MIESYEKLKKKYHEQSLKIDLNWIKNALKISNSFEVNFKTVENKRTHAEICLIQISSINETKNIVKKKHNTETNRNIATIRKTEKNYINNKIDKNSIPKVTSKTAYIEKEEHKAQPEIQAIQTNEISSFSLASVEKKKIFINKSFSNNDSNSKV